MKIFLPMYKKSGFRSETPKRYCLSIAHPDTEREAQAAATLIGLSGGNVMPGNRLMNHVAGKMEILKKIFPATPE